MCWPETSAAAGKNKNYYKTRPQKGIKSTFPKRTNEMDAEFFNLVVLYPVTSLGHP